MNGDVRMVSMKEVIRNIDREISDMTGIPEKELANMSPMEFDKRLGVTEADLPGIRYILGFIPVRYNMDEYIKKRREKVNMWLAKIVSAYYRKYGREKVRSYLR